MSGVASADPAVLEAFADATRELAVRQRRLTRQFDLAIDAARRQHRTLASAATTARSLRQISTSFDELASEAIRTAQGFRSADRVLASLGGEGGASSGGGSWDVDVPMPAEDWGFSWRLPGWPIVEWSSISERIRLDLEAGIGPRVEGGAGISVVDGVLQLGAELEAKVGAWARAAVGSAYGPFVATASGELFVGGAAAAQAAVSIGRNGIAAAGEVSAFVGAKASGEVGLDMGPVGVGASGAVTAGFGGKAEGDASFGWNRIGLRYDLGLSLGLGFEIGGEWHVEPRELFNGVVDLGEDVANSAIIRGGASAASSVFDTGADLLGDAAGAGKDLAGSAKDTGMDVLGGAAKTVTSIGGIFR